MRSFHDAEVQVLPAIGSDHSPLVLSLYPTTEEIHAAVFQLGAYKAPGPDGFNGNFYQQSWETLKSDLLQLVHNFFRTGLLDPRINQTHIVLIPKVKQPEQGAFIPGRQIQDNIFIVQEVLHHLLLQSFARS